MSHIKNIDGKNKMINFPIPIIGFCAFSGTGKTTLIEQLVPKLKQKGLTVAVIKHGHHTIDLDTKGKDTFRFREAGADQVIVCSNKTLAVMTSCEATKEPDLNKALTLIDPNCADLVIIEGFKSATYPKIELHRPSLQHPYLFLTDDQVIAIASDEPMTISLPHHVKALDLNNSNSIVDFIINTTQINPH